MIEKLPTFVRRPKSDSRAKIAIAKIALFVNPGYLQIIDN
jgi:hypothetical protein